MGKAIDQHNLQSESQPLRHTERPAFRVFYRTGIRPVYSRFRRDTQGSASVDCIYDELDTYADIAEKVRTVEEPFITEVTLPMAAAFLAELRGSRKEIVIIGTLTAFAAGHETSALFYPPGTVQSIEHLDGARPESVATWLALMFLKSQDSAILKDHKTLLARLRGTDEKPMFSYVLAALKAGVVPLVQAFLALGYPRQFEELKSLSKGIFDNVDLFDWYRNTLPQSDRSSRTELYSRVAIAPRHDWHANRGVYESYLGEWEAWKAKVTQPGQPFHVLTGCVRIDAYHAKAMSEFLARAQETLGPKILQTLGVAVAISTDRPINSNDIATT